jgi:hypothetical protein
MKWINETYTAILRSYLDQFIASKKTKGGRTAIIKKVKEEIEEAAKKEDADIPDNLHKVTLKIIRYIHLSNIIYRKFRSGFITIGLKEPYQIQNKKQEIIVMQGLGLYEKL